MAKFINLEKMDMTQEEVDKFTKAFSDPEFRKMFTEYAEEISDPENRRKYEDEITQLEQEQGVDVTFIHPQPGYVIKTTVNGTEKAFINICTSDALGTPTAKRQKKHGTKGVEWLIPHSFAPMRKDIDKSAQECKVFDVVFHPDSYRMGEKNRKFRKMMENIAFDGIVAQFGMSVDRRNVTYPKMKFKGVPTATVIRKQQDNEHLLAEELSHQQVFLDKLNFAEPTPDIQPPAGAFNPFAPPPSFSRAAPPPPASKASGDAPVLPKGPPPHHP